MEFVFEAMHIQDLLLFRDRETLSHNKIYIEKAIQCLAELILIQLGFYLLQLHQKRGKQLQNIGLQSTELNLGAGN